MAFEGPLEDRIAIRERMGAYCDASFRGDVDAWLANWTDDAVWVALGQDIKGKAAMRAAWDNIFAPLSGVGFFGEIGAIEVQGDRAKMRCYCQELLFIKTGGQQKLIGAYNDDLVRQNGVWLFARREYKLLNAEGPSPYQ